jgi:hypothetical protein
MAKKVITLSARERYRELLLLGHAFLPTSPMILLCDHCKKDVDSDMPWQCGNCNHENQGKRWYSFCKECKGCKKGVKSYSCPHCKEVNHFHKSRDSSRPAMVKIRQTETQPVIPIPNPEVERLKQELESLKAELEKKRESPLKQEYAKHESRLLELQRLRLTMRKRYRKKFKNDPEMLELADETVDLFVEKQSLKF